MSKNQLLTHISGDKKTQSCTDQPAFARGYGGINGTKLSSNLQSQNVHRTHSQVEESRFARDQKNTTRRASVKSVAASSCREFLARACPSANARYVADDNPESTPVTRDALAARFLTIRLQREIGRDAFVPGATLIQQSPGMDISSQVILAYHNVFRRLCREPRVSSRRRRSENYSICLRLVWLIVEASIA
jgi:hypothetical protein